MMGASDKLPFFACEVIQFERKIRSLRFFLEGTASIFRVLAIPLDIISVYQSGDPASYAI